MVPKPAQVIVASWFVLISSSMSVRACDWVATWPRSATDPLLWKYEVVVRARIEEMFLSIGTIASKHGSEHAVWYRLRTIEPLRGTEIEVNKPLMAYAPARECKGPHPGSNVSLLGQAYVFVLKKSSVGLQIIGGGFA